FVLFVSYYLSPPPRPPTPPLFPYTTLFRSVTAQIPLGLFTCVTGVSGSGKSTLIVDTLFGHTAARLNGARVEAAPCERIEGLEQIDRVIDIDQSPIGRTPRSNPAKIGRAHV